MLRPFMSAPPFPLRRAVAAAVVACSLAAEAAGSTPQAGSLTFDISPGPLGGALIDIAARGGVMMSFDPALVARRQSVALRGQFTLQEAFRRALEGSGLAIEISEKGVATIVPAGVHRETTFSAAPDRAADAPANVAVAPRVIVTGLSEPPTEDGLRGLRGAAATRAAVQLAELPQAVSVVTAEALALHGPLATTNDALRVVTGVSAQVGGNVGQGMVPSLAVRGLPALYALSGMRTLRGWLPIDNALIDRIEVPKGPSAVTGGVADFGGRGGGVNVVRKSADGLPRTEVAQALSSADEGTLLTSVDLGGGSGRSAWRLAGIGSRSGTTTDGHAPQHGAGLAAAFAHREGAFDVEISALADRRRVAPAPAARAIMGIGENGFSALERGAMPAVDPSDRLRWRYGNVDLDAAWKFAPQWRMTWKGRVETFASNAYQHRYLTVEDGGVSVTLLRNQLSGRHTGLQWGLEGAFQTGMAVHKVLVGLDVDRTRTSNASGNASWVLDPTSYEPGLTPLPATADVGDPAALAVRETRERRQALLLQDLMSLGPWRLRLAVQRVRTPEFFDEVTRQGPRATNSDAGVLYQFTPTFSAYVGHQYSQEADGRTADLVLFDGRPAPTRGLRQTQAGLKVEWQRQRLGFTVEGFALRQFDTLQDSSRLGGNGFFALPGRDVDGLEAELAGRPLPWLDLRLGLTLMRAHDTAPVPDTTTPQGVEVPGVGVPARSLQLLARCVLPTDGEATHAVGTVFQAYSRRWAVAPDPFNNTRGLQLPGGARLDLSWTRSAGPWSLGLAVQNVFDRVLYSGQAAPDYIPLEPQRRWVLSARYAN